VGALGAAQRAWISWGCIDRAIERSAVLAVSLDLGYDVLIHTVPREC